MKKLFLSLVAAIVAATATFAQSSLLATLSHDGSISTYYGATALRQAYADANDGDVITLSSGSFNAVDLKKGITLRGAGMAVDSTAQTEPTIINGDFTIDIPDSISQRLTIEGIFHNHTINVGTLKGGTFLKSRFNKIGSGEAKITDLTMIHCRVATSIQCRGSISFVNSVVIRPKSYYTDAFYSFVNCIVYSEYFNNTGTAAAGDASFSNCILFTTNSTKLSDSAFASHCVGIGYELLFDNISNNTNVTKTYEEVFKTFRGDYSAYGDNDLFELTDSFKAAFLGLDGTQVGIYGGNLPYDATPSNPQITKCQVAAKSTADGKLSVNITVNGAE